MHLIALSTPTKCEAHAPALVRGCRHGTVRESRGGGEAGVERKGYQRRGHQALRERRNSTSFVSRVVELCIGQRCATTQSATRLALVTQTKVRAEYRKGAGAGGRREGGGGPATRPRVVPHTHTHTHTQALPLSPLPTRLAAFKSERRRETGCGCGGVNGGERRRNRISRAGVGVRPGRQGPPCTAFPTLAHPRVISVARPRSLSTGAAGGGAGAIAARCGTGANRSNGRTEEKPKRRTKRKGRARGRCSHVGEGKIGTRWREEGRGVCERVGPGRAAERQGTEVPGDADLSDAALPRLWPPPHAHAPRRPPSCEGRTSLRHGHSVSSRGCGCGRTASGRALHLQPPRHLRELEDVRVLCPHRTE